MKSAQTSIQCATFGWDTETEQDVELPSVYVTVYTANGSIGTGHELECKTPEELWHFIRAMNKDRKGTLLQTFNYREQERKAGLPIDLGDLF